MLHTVAPPMQGQTSIFSSMYTRLMNHLRRWNSKEAAHQVMSARASQARRQTAQLGAAHVQHATQRVHKRT